MLCDSFSVGWPKLHSMKFEKSDNTQGVWFEFIYEFIKKCLFSIFFYQYRNHSLLSKRYFYDFSIEHKWYLKNFKTFKGEYH